MRSSDPRCIYGASERWRFVESSFLDRARKRVRTRGHLSREKALSRGDQPRADLSAAPRTASDGATFIILFASMSVRPYSPVSGSLAAASRKRRRRTPEALRSEALVIAKRLLISGGPSAITLTAIAAALETSHQNVLHHFGSAGELRAELQSRMLDELAEATELLLRAVTAGAVAGGSPVDGVFEQCAEGGLGKLIAWTSPDWRGGYQTQARGGARQADGGGRPAVPRRRCRGARHDAIWLVFSLALSESIMGRSIRIDRGGARETPQDLTRRLLRLMAAAEN